MSVETLKKKFRSRVMKFYNGVLIEKISFDTFPGMHHQTVLNFVTVIMLFIQGDSVIVYSVSFKRR